MPESKPSPAADPKKGPATPSMPEAQAAAWRRRKDAALEGTKPFLDKGKTNIARYRGQYLDARPKDDQVIVPSDFYYVEQKKPQLFYRLPELFLKPEQPGLDDAAIVYGAAISKKLGPAGVNVLPKIQEVLFDVLCPVPFGAVKIGYEAVVDGTVDVVIGQAPDIEAMQVGAVLGLGGMPMKPVMGKAPDIIAKRYFIERIAPGDLLVPAEFSGSDFDEAPWIGHRFKEDLPDGADGGSEVDDDRRLTELSSAARTAMRRQRVGYEIYYKASLFDTDCKHPDVIRCFKFYDDDREIIEKSKLCPYQRYDGRTPEEVGADVRSIRKVSGMPGYCIAPLTIRYVSDTWLAESDCTMARAQADEMSKGRTQMVQFRDRSMPQVGYDATTVTKETLAKIERNETGGWVGFDGPHRDSVWPIEKGKFGRESFAFNDIGQADLDRIWGIPRHQQAVGAQGSPTATELQLVDNAAKDRMQSDRERVLAWYCHKVVPKFGSLLQLFADEEEFVELIGSDAQRLKSIPPEIAQQAQAAGQNASVLVPWNKDAIQGRFSFTAKPDSQLHLDLAMLREQILKLYQFTANEPTSVRQELVKEVYKSFHYDPAKFTQPPPQKQADPPKPSLSFKGDDFSPLNAQSPICLDMATKLGVPVDPKAIEASLMLAGVLQQMMAAQAAAEAAINGAGPQTEHGGAAKQQEPLSKHADLSGGMQGSGAPAPIAPGGMLQ